MQTLSDRDSIEVLLKDKLLTSYKNIILKTVKIPRNLIVKLVRKRKSKIIQENCITVKGILIPRLTKLL